MTTTTLQTKEDWEAADREARRAYREQFKKGVKFRCLTPIRITGMRSRGPRCWQGYGETFPAGSILTCLGESMTFGDGVPAIKWGREDDQVICMDALIEDVVGGMWGGQIPTPGLLEVVP